VVNLTNEQLQEIVAYWKIELGLQGWHVDITICRASQMQLEYVAGENEYCHQLKTALISVLDVVDYGDRIVKLDQEKVIVHELLHCMFSTIDTEETILSRVQHQMIETLANALVNAKRFKEGNSNTLPQ